MALDLSAPLTYAADLSKLDCNPDPAVESACPFQQVDASGLARVITSLPLAADRVLFRQSARDRPGRGRRDQLARADRHVQWLPGPVHRG